MPADHVQIAKGPVSEDVASWAREAFLQKAGGRGVGRDGHVLRTHELEHQFAGPR